jgi:putative ABC transport system ATP-binding protein
MALLLAQTREQGAALVVVTHSAAVAEQADRLVRLRPDGVRSV